MKKYVFKPYSPLFPILFDRENKRLSTSIQAVITIEHVGSTAVAELAGKGIIDIAIAADRQEIESISLQLKTLGYEWSASGTTPERLFFKIELPDPLERFRTYHLHLTHHQSVDWKGFLEFRDFLRANPKAAQEYSDIKKRATEQSLDGESYRRLKQPFFKKVLQATSLAKSLDI